jgi:hypothetical protein
MHNPVDVALDPVETTRMNQVHSSDILSISTYILICGGTLCQVGIVALTECSCNFSFAVVFPAHMLDFFAAVANSRLCCQDGFFRWIWDSNKPTSFMRCSGPLIRHSKAALNEHLRAHLSVTPV